MKNILLPIVILFSLSAWAQSEQADTTMVTDLDEVVVEAANQYTTANVTTYIPQSRQKKTATDAVSLLNKMAIPQLDVPFGAGNTSVKTIGGESVDIFIDYVPASAADLTGMQTMDVKRVEFLVYPQDPRFRGAHYAINFIMQKYEWGGYTKLTGSKWFGADRNENAQLYSKFAYKKMTFDFYADEKYKKTHHEGMNSTHVYNLPNYQDMEPQSIEKDESTLSSVSRFNNNNLTFRALYNTDNLQITNNLSFNNSVAPRNYSEDVVSYSDDIFPASTSLNNMSSHSQLINYTFKLYAAMSKKLYLNLEADYSFSTTKSASRYNYTDLTISNNAINYNREYELSATQNWKITDQHIISGQIWVIGADRDINYSGNSMSRNEGTNLHILIGPHYHFYYNNLSLGSDIMWEYNKDAISGHKHSEQYFQGDLWASYSPNNKNQLTAEIQTYQNNPSMSTRNPVMLQDNELLWYEGNPNLKQTRYYNYSLSYTWLPSNKWQFGANCKYVNGLDVMRNIFSPDGPDGSLLRKYENNGNYRWFTATMSATAKYLDGKLIAGFNPRYSYYKCTGMYNREQHSIYGEFRLSYYFGDFYVTGYYQTPSKDLSNMGYKMWTPANYQIYAGWGNGAWRVMVSAYKFLNSGWKDGRYSFYSQYYSYDQTAFSSGGHRQFYINVSYTFGYGKKVKQGNEIGGIGTAENAILK
ncbi:MAG: outer membrane beta-barrel family protein [Duncaniella sp.]|nr:outer membrane beta-barrel family protein [Duncaniella sp.]